MSLRVFAMLGSVCLLSWLAGPASSAPPYRGHLSTNYAVARSSYAFRPTATIGATNFGLAHSNYSTALAYNQAAASQAWRQNNHFVRNFEFSNGYYPYGFYNPYAYSPYRYYPYGYFPTYPAYTTPAIYNYAPSYNSYASGLSPYSYGITAPYGMAGSGPTGQPADVSPPPAAVKAPAPQVNQAQPLTAFGIPNDKGAVSWPLAFRLMPPDQKKDLLDKAEAQLQIVSTQAVVGTSNPLLLRETTRSVDELRQWLRNHRVNMTENNFRDGEAFLRKLDQALTAMAPT